MTLLAPPFSGPAGVLTAVVGPSANAAAPTLAGLYAAHARSVAEIAFRLMGHDRDLDDVVQETFLDVSSQLDERDREVPERTWVLTLAVRRVRRLLAKRRRFRIFGFRWLEATPASTDPRGKEPAFDLYEALDALPEDLRVPFCLHRIEQFTLPRDRQRLRRLARDGEAAHRRSRRSTLEEARRMIMETALERSLQSARNRTPDWTEARAENVLGNIQRRDRARATRGRFAVAIVGLAAAALFVARAASGGTDFPDSPLRTAETQSSLALGDAGLLPD